MSNSCHTDDLAKLTVVTAIIFSLFAVNIASAQSSSSAQNLTTRPLPESPPDLNRAPRTIHRTGTAISGARNSISIKSTDAGIIHRQPPASGCINCGIVDFVNKMGQAGGLNAIAGGVVAGTVAREILQYTPHLHPHGANHPNPAGGHHGNNTANPGNQYQVGVTMNDGRQAIITLPDAANFHQGDKVKLMDGVLVPDRQ